MVNVNSVFWQVTVVQKLACWAHTPAIPVQIPAGNLPTKSVTITLKALLRKPPCGTCKKEAAQYQITGLLSLEA